MCRKFRGALVFSSALGSRAFAAIHENSWITAVMATNRAAFGNDEIVGVSQALARVLEQVRVVANTDATVLILGETGVGKELIARRIHDESSRQRGPMITMNCASIPRDLFESSSSDMYAGPSRARHAIALGESKRLMAGLSFSTKSGRFRWSCKASC